MYPKKRESRYDVNDVRRRLQLTEHTLHNLDALDKHGRVRAPQNQGRELPSSPESAHMAALTLDDLSPEHSSDSYQPPRKPQHGNNTRKEKHTGVSWKAVRKEASNEGSFLKPHSAAVTSLPLSNISMMSSSFDEENSSLRSRLQQLREENAHLIQQNHSLLNQLETSAYQLKQAQCGVQQMSQQLEKQSVIRTRLEQQLQALSADNHILQEKISALEAEQAVTKEQAQTSDSLVATLQSKCDDLKSQLHLAMRQRDKAEQNSKMSLKTAEGIQHSYEEFQQDVQKKMKQRDSHVADLGEKLRYVETERKDLFSQLSSLQEQITDRSTEIRRLTEENNIQRETRSEVEAINIDLRMEVAKYTHIIVDLEGKLSVLDDFDELRREYDAQQREMARCQEEMEQLRSQAMSQTETPDNSYLNNLSEVLSKSTGAYTEVITNLSQKLAQKEIQIQHLKSECSSVKNFSGSVIDPKTDKAEQQERQKLEAESSRLEEELSQVEEERDKLAGHVLDLQSQTGALEEDIGSLNTKLKHRASQVEELQRDLRGKENEVTQTQREVRKIRSQLTTAERQLDEKVHEVTQNVVQIRGLEEEVEQISGLLSSTQQQLSELQMARMTHDSQTEKVQALHAQQCHELQMQVELMEQRVGEAVSKLQDCEKNLEVSERSLQAKDSELTYVKQELESRSERSQSTLNDLQMRLEKALHQIRDQEAVLVVTKQEVQLQVDQMEESKSHYEQQLLVKSSELSRAREELVSLSERLSSQEVGRGQIEVTLAERQQLLEKSNNRLSELEEVQGQMQAEVCRLERQLESDRGNHQMELSTAAQKLTQVSSDLSRKDHQIRELYQQLQSSQGEKNQLSGRVRELEEELDEGRRDLEEEGDISKKLEADLKLARDQIEEQMAKVERLEEDLERSNGDLEDRSAKVKELQSQLSEQQTERGEDKAELEHLHGTLQSAKEKLEQHQEMLNTLKQALRNKEDEARSYSREMEELSAALAQRQWELKQRAAQVTQIDMTMKEHGTQTEQRLMRLEAALKKSTVDAQQGAQQVAALDENVRQLQNQLRERGLELQQVHQLVQQGRVQLQQKEQLLQQAQQRQTMLEQKQQEADQENMQLKQQLIFARDEHQKLTHSLTECRQEMGLLSRGKEQVSSNLQELREKLQMRENEAGKLRDEVNLSRAREAQMKARNEAEIRKLQRQLDITKDEHTGELQSLHEQLTLQHGAQQEQQNSLQLELQKLQRTESLLNAELEDSRHLAVELQAGLSNARSKLIHANESVVLKEAEAARLEAKVSSLQRSLSHLSNASITTQSSFPTSNEMPATSSRNNSRQVHILTSSQLPELDFSAIPVESSVSNQKENSSGSITLTVEPTWDHPEKRNIQPSLGLQGVGNALTNVTDPDSFQGMLQEVNKDLYGEQNLQSLPPGGVMAASLPEPRKSQQISTQSKPNPSKTRSASVSSKTKSKKTAPGTSDHKRRGTSSSAPGAGKATTSRQAKTNPNKHDPETKNTSQNGDVRERLRVLMTKMNSLGVPNTGGYDENTSSNNAASSDPKHHDTSPNFLSKSLDVSSAIGHYDELEVTSVKGSDIIPPKVLTFDSDTVESHCLDNSTGSDGDVTC